MDYEKATPAQHGFEDAYLCLGWDPDPTWTEQQLKEYRHAYRETFLDQYGFYPDEY